MKLDLLVFFKLIENESYVVIKPSDLLPDYIVGSDIDIFCYHPQSLVEKITTFLSSYINDDSSISIVDNREKVHIDYILNNEINFRFDIYKSLPEYHNIQLKSAFFSSSIECCISKELSKDNVSVNVKVPSTIDDFILRYVEYQEYYAQRPDKIKHIEYIKNKLLNNVNTPELALDKLHYYTAFPKRIYRAKTITERFNEKIDYYLSIVEKLKYLYQTVGFKKLISKVIIKLKG